MSEWKIFTWQISSNNFPTVTVTSTIPLLVNIQMANGKEVANDNNSTSRKYPTGNLPHPNGKYPGVSCPQNNFPVVTGSYNFNIPPRENIRVENIRMANIWMANIRMVNIRMANI